MGGVTCTDGGVVEVGGRLGIDNDLGRSCDGLCAHSGCASIGASHIQGAIRTCGVLLVGCVATRACP